MRIHGPKPTVTLGNYKKVYQYSRENLPNPEMTMFGQDLMSCVMHPKVYAVPGAIQKIEDHARAGGQLLFAANHVNGFDPTILATMQARVPVLNFTREFTTGIIKTSLMQDINFSLTKGGVLSLFNPVLRWAVEQMRSVPAFREIDYTDESGYISPEDKKLVSAAGIALVGVVGERIKLGDNGMLYPEETRNRDDPLVLAEFKDGVGFIAARGYKETDGRLWIQPYGAFYGEDLLQPTVVLGEPINPGEDGRRPKSHELTLLTHAAVQQCVTIAAELHQAA